MTQDAALRWAQRTQRKIEIDPILAFATQRDASAAEGVHKLKRNATRLASYCEPALRLPNTCRENNNLFKLPCKFIFHVVHGHYATALAHDSDSPTNTN